VPLPVHCAAVSPLLSKPRTYDPNAVVPDKKPESYGNST
jgi:hypothetical protein